MTNKQKTSTSTEMASAAWGSLRNKAFLLDYTEELKSKSTLTQSQTASQEVLEFLIDGCN
jgi:hypothetical protein